MPGSWPDNESSPNILPRIMSNIRQTNNDQSGYLQPLQRMFTEYRGIDPNCQSFSFISSSQAVTIQYDDIVNWQQTDGRHRDSESTL